MFDNMLWTDWIPAGVLVYAILAYVWFWFEGKRLDKKYGRFDE